MDVRIHSGARMPDPAGKAPQQKKTAPAAPFSELLRAAAPAKKDGDFSAETAEEVFARALADRSDPDLNRLDEYMEWLIRNQ